jgi:ferredoxin-NADP reductase
MPIQEFDAKIEQIIQETTETRTFVFSLPAKEMNYIPGQFAMLTVDIPGIGITSRAYSISSSPLDDKFTLTIEKVENGKMTTFLIEKAYVGMQCKLKGPYGMLTLNESAKKVVFIAAGCGISPFRSMWRYIIQKNLPMQTILLYSSKKTDHIIYKKELDEISSKIKVVHTLTKNEDPSWKGYSRRIDKQMLLEVVGDVKDTYFYLCGPPAMCHAAQDELKELGVPDERIKMEKFN